MWTWQLLPEERDVTHSPRERDSLETTEGGVTWTRVVYEIESETLSNYKNLREKLLDQIDDIYLARISNPEQPVSNIEIILIQNW